MGGAVFRCCCCRGGGSGGGGGGLGPLQPAEE